jgi:hypothetical protein
MEQDFAGQRMVGWYHSHPHFGIFLSDYDQFIHENFFREPWQVAYVVDPLLEQRGWFGWVDGKLVRFPAWQTFRTERGEGADRPVGSPPTNRPDPVLKVESLDPEPPTKGTGPASYVLLFLFALLAGGALATVLFGDDGSAASATLAVDDPTEDPSGPVDSSIPVVTGFLATDLPPEDVHVDAWVTGPDGVAEATAVPVVDGRRIVVDVQVPDLELPEGREEVDAMLHVAVTGCADDPCEGDQVTEVTTHPFTVTEDEDEDDGFEIPFLDAALSIGSDWFEGAIGPSVPQEWLLVTSSPIEGDDRTVAELAELNDAEVVGAYPRIGVYQLRGDVTDEVPEGPWNLLALRGYDDTSRRLARPGHVRERSPSDQARRSGRRGRRSARRGRGTLRDLGVPTGGRSARPQRGSHQPGRRAQRGQSHGCRAGCRRGRGARHTCCGGRPGGRLRGVPGRSAADHGRRRRLEGQRWTTLGPGRSRLRRGRRADRGRSRRRGLIAGPGLRRRQPGQR